MVPQGDDVRRWPGGSGGPGQHGSQPPFQVPPRTGAQLPGAGRIRGTAALVGLFAEALGVLVIALSLRSSDLLSVFLVGSEILFNLAAILGLIFLWGSWGRKARSGTPDSALLVRMNDAFRGHTILLGVLTGIAAITGLFSAVAFHAAGADVMGLWATLYSLTGGAAVVAMLVRSRRHVRAIATALGTPGVSPHAASRLRASR